MVEYKFLQEIINVLVVREMSFGEYCQKHDEAMLEYDVGYAWIEWEKHGPTFEVLHPDGKLTVMWKPETK